MILPPPPDVPTVREYTRNALGALVPNVCREVVKVRLYGPLRKISGLYRRGRWWPFTDARRSCRGARGRSKRRCRRADRGRCA